MTVDIRYKNIMPGSQPYLFIAGPADAELFADGAFEMLPPLPVDLYADFIQSYNATVAGLWQENRDNLVFTFLPIALRNTWQSAFYLGSESCARLALVDGGSVYFSCPHWFLWAARMEVFRAAPADIARARSDARKLILQAGLARLRGIYFALSQYSFPKHLPSGIRTCFFSIWTAAGQRQWRGSAHDPFYGGLPAETPQSALVYHAEGRRAADQIDDSGAARRDTSLLRIRDWFFIILKIITFSFAAGDAESRNVGAIKADAFATLANQGVLALISFCTARNLAERNPGIKFVTLYEGNCWEQGVVRAAQAQDNKIVAIQHTAFSPGMLKMRGDGHGTLPAQIISSGPGAAQLLIAQMGHEPQRIVDGFRIRDQGAMPGQQPAAGENILVLLQGSPYDRLMLSRLRSLSLPYPVVVRFHPAHVLDDAHGFEVSTGSLQEDLGRALVVLYNGTAAALDALRAGVPCIYVASGDNGRQDPLFDMNDVMKGLCLDIASLPGMLSSIMAMPAEDRRDGAVRARAYVDHYFRPATANVRDNVREILKNE